MKLIIGLGNPGKKYLYSRHNAGFMFLNHLAGSKKWNESKKGKLHYLWQTINQEEIELVKPQTFMNESGQALVYIKKKHRDFDSHNLFVVHDDLDLFLGEYKIQFGRGPKQHNGLLSIERFLASKDFWRIRIGVKGENYRRVKMIGKTMADDYLLKPFGQKELVILQKTICYSSEELITLINNHR